MKYPTKASLVKKIKGLWIQIHTLNYFQVVVKWRDDPKIYNDTILVSSLYLVHNSPEDTAVFYHFYSVEELIKFVLEDYKYADFTILDIHQ